MNGMSQSNVIFLILVLTSAASSLPSEGTGVARVDTQSALTGPDDVIWDNGTNDGMGSHSSQHDSLYSGFHSDVADDFNLCKQNNAQPDDRFVVTGVQWYGVYWNGDDHPNQGFTIDFHAEDDDGFPTPPGNELLSQFIPLANTNETPAGGEREFSYSAELPIPFVADCGTDYWLGIQSLMLFAPQWGWSHTASQHNEVAVQGFPLLEIPYWTPLDQDAAFRLTGKLIPEPTSLALLLGSIALFVAGRDRRR